MRLPATNCQHRDNWGGCRVHRAHWLVRLLAPGARPSCILDRTYPPRDGAWTCEDQLPLPRPAPPAPWKIDGPLRKVY
jgi:hypothetical protein